MSDQEQQDGTRRKKKETDEGEKEEEKRNGEHAPYWLRTSQGTGRPLRTGGSRYAIKQDCTFSQITLKTITKIQ